MVFAKARSQPREDARGPDPSQPDPQSGHPLVQFACSADRFVAQCFHLPGAVGRQSARSPAACPDGILKNSKARLGL